MSIGSPFHVRTAPLNRKQQWREWSGYWASSAYADAHDIEYNAIREAAALIDVSPLYKYRVTGRDALALVDRVITRDATKLKVGQVYYTPWCDEHGKVIDDGTVHRLAEDEFFWTAADPQLRWLTLNARSLEVEIEDVTESIAAVALQGPFARAVLEEATEEPFAELRYFRRRPSVLRGAAMQGGGAKSAGDARKGAGILSAPLEIGVSRTGYTGDLGYEVWVPAERAAEAWDALMAAGRAYGIRPAGMLALDVVRLEAGLVLLEVDYTSARHAHNPEQNYSPFELGMGRLVDFGKSADFTGRLALQREQARGGPKRRLVGVQLDWRGIEQSFSRQDLAPSISSVIDRSAVPVFVPGRDRQIGKLTSHGLSPILKRAIGLASVPPEYEAPGSKLDVEWTVEGHRGRVGAVVTPLPFLDLPRKRA